MVCTPEPNCVHAFVGVLLLCVSCILQGCGSGDRDYVGVEPTVPIPGTGSDNDFIETYLDRNRICLESRDGWSGQTKEVRPNDYAFISHLRNLNALSDPPAPRPGSALFEQLQASSKYLATANVDDTSVTKLKFDFYPCGRSWYHNLENEGLSTSTVTMIPGTFTDYRDKVVASIGLINKTLPIYGDSNCSFKQWIENKSSCSSPVREEQICGNHWASRDGFLWAEGDELRSVVTEFGAVGRQPCNSQTGLEMERYFFCPEQVAAEGGWVWQDKDTFVVCSKGGGCGGEQGRTSTKFVPGHELRKDRIMVEASDGLSMGTFLFHISGERGNPARLDTFSMDMMMAYFNYLIEPKLDPDLMTRLSELRPGSGRLTESAMFAVATNQRHFREIFPEIRHYMASGKLLLAYMGKLCDPEVDFIQWSTFYTMKNLFGDLLKADVPDSLMKMAEEVELPKNQQLCDDMLVAVKLLVMGLINQEEIIPVSTFEERWMKVKEGLEQFEVFGVSPLEGISKHIDIFDYGHETMLDKFPQCPHRMSAVEQSQDHFPEYTSNTHARWHLLSAQFLGRMYRIAKSIEDYKWDHINRTDVNGMTYRYHMKGLYKPDPRNDETTHPDWATEGTCTWHDWRCDSWRWWGCEKWRCVSADEGSSAITPYTADIASTAITASSSSKTIYCKSSARYCNNRVWLSETRISQKSIPEYFLSMLQNIGGEVEGLVRINNARTQQKGISVTGG